MVKWIPDILGIDFSFQPRLPETNPGRMTYWDVSYRVLSNTLDKLEVEDSAYGTKKGLTDISNFY